MTLKLSFSSIAIIVTATFLLLIALKASVIVQWAFLPVAVSLAGWTYLKSPHRDYLTLALLLWLYAPLFRRLVDWQLGRTDASLIMLTPLLVSALAWVSVSFAYKDIPPFIRNSALLLAGALVFGTISGIIQGHGAAALIDFLTLAAPVGLGLHVLCSPSFSMDRLQHIARQFALHGAFIAVYGIAQFTLGFPWDLAWIDAAPINSVGEPEAFGFRVFSTANAPLVLAAFLTATTFVLLQTNTYLQILVTAPISICLALTLVRTSWLACALVGLMLLVLGTAQMRLKFAVTAFVVILVGAIYATVLGSPVAITERVLSTLNLSQDQSFTDRVAFTAGVTSDLFLSPIGHGLGATGISSVLSSNPGVIRSFDNGLLDLPYKLGWLALGVWYILGVWAYSLTKRLLSPTPAAPFAAGALALLAHLPSVNILAGTTGALFFLLSAFAFLQPIPANIAPWPNRASSVMRVT